MEPLGLKSTYQIFLLAIQIQQLLEQLLGSFTADHFLLETKFSQKFQSVARILEKDIISVSTVWPIPNTSACKGAMLFPATLKIPATAAPRESQGRGEI